MAAQAHSKKARHTWQARSMLLLGFGWEGSGGCFETKSDDSDSFVEILCICLPG